MSKTKAQTPELKRYMDKHVFIQLNGNRKVTGVLRGFDPFMNIVLDETEEEVSPTERVNIGMTVIRGNSIFLIEARERITNN
ncbi:small nuclear ribonucleo protein polypeptide G-like protein [Gonapodya prolifera JEL478]|uniref:Small nuclear ribonucleoprotein G n=1 Tax=Gonapodya prolifera (strain JEL478) TaxID=1344416 RepID=A0A139AAJ1_GONPJ|nr:small nuclear ribonucleo protein polypeptide G-like protein [Gonapodya prolifera JEL478]|eukprot:KXS13674.1 small nuclear ribonucleo protein polypeptide G-like protein [Gonapodya prolifera JEL478]